MSSQRKQPLGRRVFGTSKVLVLLAVLWLPSTTALGQEQTLYQRLGGYDAVAAVVDDFIGRLAADPAITKFFIGHSTDSQQQIRQFIVDQLCEATGGPCVYKGRDMKTSHEGLGITEAEWEKAVVHLVATLDKFNVPPAEKDEVLALVGTLKKDIVEKM